jgi:Tfp pilus assembly protein PilF/outer membrane receptor protein involved in Fe transport
MQRWARFALVVAWAALTSTAPAQTIRVQQIQGRVELMPTGATRWVLVQTNEVIQPGERLRTGLDSRASLRWSDQSIVPIGELTEIEVLEPHSSDALSGLHLLRGILSFFHRDKPGRIRILTRGGVAGVEGTEFVLRVEEVGQREQTTLSLIDGQVEFTNLWGRVVLTNGQGVVASAGQAPMRTAGFIANNILQWVFYYPAVLDVQELPWSMAERQVVSDSLEAYRAGELLGALARFPAEPGTNSPSLQLYRAALLLAVGQVEKTERLLEALPPAAEASSGARLKQLSDALRVLIASVKGEPHLNEGQTNTPPLATARLAASYYEQGRTPGEEGLRRALSLAREAVEQSPDFSFAWVRVAELEFSFRHSDKARKAFERGMALAPRNAQALALGGFLAAGENRTREALGWFERALAADAALGNAWLGRGLCRIRLGDQARGREDLLTAAALEPQRALLRSYLAKAYADDGDLPQARRELELAKRLDAADPTAWLYSALIADQGNRLNEGIRELERSEELNENRRLYRSQLLLDQDRAVRSSSLATLYARAGMDRVGLREATKAVSADYSSASAHQFLSESFGALRDPTRFNLRYETVWFSELLLANVLSPVGATPLSQHVSQHEYSSLFEREGPGLSTLTQYRSDGQFQEVASQTGRYGNTAWALDVDYQHNDGIRPNNELERAEWYTTIKQQLNAHDSLLLLTKVQSYHSGDNFQYYDPTNASRYFHYDEEQKPILLGAFHREWRPGAHTLFLGGRLENDQRFSDRATFQTIVDTNPPQVFLNFDNIDLHHHSQLEIFTAEVQQLFENSRHLFLAGARWQGGDFDTATRFSNPAFFPPSDFDPSLARTRVPEDYQRTTVYGYETLKLPGRLHLTGGFVYEELKFPSNFRSPPIQPGEEARRRLNPKAGLVWEALPQATVRAAYARSLGGVSLDESYGLEPRQVAGFSQSFRTLIPESLAGSVAAPDHELVGGAVDLKLASGTYLGLQGEWLQSEVSRDAGLFYHFFANPPPNIFSDRIRQHLDYDERSASVVFNQLLSQEWSLGAGYSFTRSELVTRTPGLGTGEQLHADLHRPEAFLLYAHPSGFFARTGLELYIQNNSRARVAAGAVTNVPDEFVPELSLLVGYRFPRNYGDITLGGLNLLGEDYRLNPVTPYMELPRERVFMVRLRLRF